MSISIIDRDNLMDEALRELAERRLLFALSRFDTRVEKVELVASDENGPRGGNDKLCRVHVWLKRASDVQISDQDADLAVCLSRVAERVGRAVGRSIERAQDFSRTRMNGVDH